MVRPVKIIFHFARVKFNTVKLKERIRWGWLVVLVVVCWESVTVSHSNPIVMTALVPSLYSNNSHRIGNNNNASYLHNIHSDNIIISPY